MNLDDYLQYTTRRMDRAQYLPGQVFWTTMNALGSLAALLKDRHCRRNRP